MKQMEFGILANDIRPTIFEMAWRHLGNEDEADDVAQDTLLKLWCMRDRLGQYRSVKALAIVIARRLCIDRLRSIKAISIDDVSFVGYDDSPEDAIMRQEERDRIEHVVSSLPDGLQTVLRLKHIEGMETVEIAQMLGSSEVSIRVALSRARRRVRDMFLTQKR